MWGLDGEHVGEVFEFGLSGYFPLNKRDSCQDFSIQCGCSKRVCGISTVKMWFNCKRVHYSSSHSLIILK